MDLDIKSKILLEFSRLGDRTAQIRAELVARNFSAFLPWQKFIDGFTDETELQEMELIKVEQIKETMGAIFGDWGTGRRRLGYQSAFLDYLRQERDARLDLEKIPESHRSMRPYSFIHASEWRRFNMTKTDAPRYEEMERRHLRETPLIISKEVEIHRKRIDSIIKANPERVTANMVTEGLRQQLGPLGFVVDTKRRKRHYPAFKKEIYQGWELCWQTDDFGLPGIADSGFVVPFVYVCASGMTRDIRKIIQVAPREQHVKFEIEALVPGIRTYHSCNSAEEVCLAVLAQTTLYEIISCDLDASLQKVLCGKTE